ncbi:MAG: sugar transferase [Candidatus Limiplasma sp.]|nr:sugar transferase [Candidatus Limiplasma sp.]MEA5146746.1 sugar transferase [Candidatus Limiplasma sp.]
MMESTTLSMAEHAATLRYWNAYAPTAWVTQTNAQRLLAGYRDPPGYLIAKRAMDILLSLCALVILAPLMLAAALLIWLDDPHGSPIFMQERIGKNGKPFRFLKFRSMVVDAEARLAALQASNEMDGPVFKIKEDPRVTRVGRIIRRTSIDELPQLWNILAGDMTLVGPRPPLPREVQQYGAYEAQRLLVKPGLTCYWQARGRNEITFGEWMELDMRYVYRHDLWVDIRLIALTLRAVLTGRGAM